VKIEVKVKPKVYPPPVAKIVKFSNRGLVTVLWNKDMRVPTPNKLTSIPTDKEEWFDKRGFPEQKPIMEIVIKRG
jgi:hypothetical protein